MRQFSVPIAILLTMAATGCKTPVVFTTNTSLGLDVSGTAQMPNKVSLSHRRFEGAIIPRKTNGEAHSVYGGLDADMTFFRGQTIKQTFATGKAAMLATGADTTDIQSQSNVNAKDALVFCTDTTFGLHLSAGEQQMAPNLLLGYRRTEGAFIPVPDPSQEVRSVYADILINSSTDTNGSITTNFSALRGVRIKQSFATGRAAEAIASTEGGKAKLDAMAGIEATKKTLRETKAKALDMVDKIRTELDRLNDNRLGQAVTALKQAGVFETTDFPAPDTIPPRELCRRIKSGLARKTADEFVNPEMLKQLQDALAQLKQIQN